MGVVRTTVSIPEDLYVELKRETQKQGMSISKFVAVSLKDFLLDQKKKKAAEEILEMVKREPLSPEATREALEEVKKLKGEWL